MYKIISQLENTNISGELEITKLTDFYQECPKHEEVENFKFSPLFESLDYDIVTLKPVKDDFLILYNNQVFWKIINEDFPAYMKGRYISELFPVFNQIHLIEKYQDSVKNGTQYSFFFKMYEDDDLIFAGKQFTVKQEDLLFIVTKDETEYYLNHENEINILKGSTIPILNINNQGKIIKANDAFNNTFKYSIKDLNIIGLETFIKNFNPITKDVKNLNEAIKLIFKEQMPLFDLEIEIKRENNLLNWYNVHLRLINNRYIRVTLRDITKNKKHDQIVKNLMDYFTDLGESDNSVFVVYDGEKFHWTENIFNILEIEPKLELLKNEKNIIDEYLLSGDKKDIDNYLKIINQEKTSKTFEYKIRTNKGNIKSLKTTLKSLGDGLAYYGITLDKTEKYNTQKQVNKLQKNLNTIQTSTNIGISSFKNGTYTYSPEIFNILELDPNSHDGKSDIFKPLVVSEEKDSWFKFINNLTPSNPQGHKVTTLKTEKGNIKIIDNVIEAEFDENGEMIDYTSYVRDVTNEELVKKSALELQENLDVLGGFCKIIIVSFKDGVYTWTPEIYNILKISSDDYPNNVDLISEFASEEDNLAFSEEMDKLTPENNTFSILRKIHDNEGGLKYLNLKLVAKFNDNGVIESIYKFLQDVTEETLIKEESLRLMDEFELVQNTSKIFIGEYERGKFYYTSEAYNVLGIEPDEYSDDVDIVLKYVVSEDYEKWHVAAYLTPENPDAQTSYRIKNNNGELKYLNVNTKAKFNNHGELIRLVGFFQDVTEETLAKESALKLEKNIATIQKSSKIIIINYYDDKFSYTSEIYDILEIKPEDYPKDLDLIEYFTIPKEKGIFYDKINNLNIDNPRFTNIATVCTINGDIKFLEGYVEVEFGENGDFLGFVAFVHEITDKVLREQELEQLSDERKLLLQEVHHRVKNNLQLVSSFLQLDSRYYKDRPDYVIEKTKNRIDAMALAHEEVYRSRNVSHINVESLIVNVLTDLFSSLKANNIKLRFDIESVYIDIDKAMPLSFLVSELALNTINHAFSDGEEGHFYLDLKAGENWDTLCVWDDGVGLPEGVDLFSGNLGFVIVRKLSDQLEADLTPLNNVKGFGLKLLIPKD